jgi:hypothetical protein
LIHGQAAYYTAQLVEIKRRLDLRQPGFRGNLGTMIGEKSEDTKTRFARPSMMVPPV